MPIPDSINQGTAQPDDDYDDLEPYWADYEDVDFDDDEDDELEASHGADLGDPA